MPKQTIYHDKLASDFLATIPVSGLTALVTDPESKNPYLLRTKDGKPARTKGPVYGPIGVGRTFEFKSTVLRNIPPENRAHEELLRDWIADKVFTDLKEHTDIEVNAFHLYDPITVKALEGHVTDLGYTVLFYTIEEQPKEETPSS